MNKKYIFLVLICFIAAGAIFYRNIELRYEMRGETISILERYYAGEDAYLSEPNQGGRSFAVTGADPQMYLSAEEGQILADTAVGGVEIVFAEPWGEEKPLAIQLFYAKEQENYSEKHSVKTSLETGESRVLLPVPIGEYSSFRIDIDGNFSLADIRVCTETMLKERYISERTIRFSLWQITGAVIGICLVFWAHSAKRKQLLLSRGAYLSYLLVGQSGGGREACYDVLRVLATGFVILVHSCTDAINRWGNEGWKPLLLQCAATLGMCSTPLYVMLSGACLLGRKKSDEGIYHFYIKRISRVFIPLIAYYIFMQQLNGELSLLPPENVLDALKNVALSTPTNARYLWLIYVILGISFSVPFLNVMVCGLNDRMLTALGGVIFVCDALATYLPLFGMSLGFSCFLAEWEGMFLMGFLWKHFCGVSEKSVKMSERIKGAVYLAAIISYVIMLAAVCNNSANTDYVYNNTPTMLVTAGGIFVFFLQKKEWFAKRSRFVLRLLSRYSYSIILIHWYVVFTIVEGKLNVHPLRYGCVGGIAATLALTFLIGLAISIVFDNTAVLVLTSLFEKVFAEKIPAVMAIIKNNKKQPT